MNKIKCFEIDCDCAKVTAVFKGKRSCLVCYQKGMLFIIPTKKKYRDMSYVQYVSIEETDEPIIPDYYYFIGSMLDKDSKSRYFKNPARFTVLRNKRTNSELTGEQYEKLAQAVSRVYTCYDKIFGQATADDFEVLTT